MKIVTFDTPVMGTIKTKYSVNVSADGMVKDITPPLS